jgi:hypothetical protein
MGLRESRRGSLGTIPALLQAALFLTVWVAISGGLHLDGLADSADSADSAGGFGDRERSLRSCRVRAAGRLPWCCCSSSSRW